MIWVVLYYLKVSRWHADLCHAVPCYAVLCHAELCHAMLCCTRRHPLTCHHKIGIYWHKLIEHGEPICLGCSTQHSSLCMLLTMLPSAQVAHSAPCWHVCPPACSLLGSVCYCYGGFASSQPSGTELWDSAVHAQHQHSTAQHSTAQLSSAQHSSAQLSTAQLSTAQLSTAQLSTAQLSTAQHSSAQLSTAQHSSAQLSTAQRSSA